MIAQIVGVAVLMALLLGGAFRPGLLIAGSFLTYQAGAVSGLGWIGTVYVAAAAAISLVHFAKDRIRVSFTGSDGAMLLLVMLLVISSAWAPDSGQASVMAVQLLLSVAGMYLIARFQKGNVTELVQDICVGLALGGAIMSACILSLRVTSSAHEQTRLYIENDAASVVGMALALPYAMFAALMLMVVARRPWQVALGIGTLPVIAYCAMVSATRSVFLAFGLGAIVALLLAPRLLSSSRMAANGLMALMAIPLGIALIPEAAYENLVLRFIGRRGGEASSSGRENLYADGWRIINEHPIWGAGYGSFREFSTFSYPHNMIIEITAAVGVVGLALLLVWLAFVVVQTISFARLLPVSFILMMGLLVIVLVQYQVSGAFYMARPLFLLSALTAALAKGQLNGGPAFRRGPRPAMRRRAAFEGETGT